MKINIYLIILVSIATYSCNKVNLQVADTNVPVVECYLNPNEEISVKIVKQLTYSSSDTANAYLNNLEVYLMNDEGNFLLNNTGQGIYTNNEISVLTNEEYSLEFYYNSKTVSAKTYTPDKPVDFEASATTIEVFSFEDHTPGSGTPPVMPDPITFSWSNENTDYHMIVVENIEDDPELINESDDRPPRLFRNAPTTGASQELNQMTFSYYGSHQVILYKLNAEYAALYEYLGTSSLDITSPPTNIVNGLGIFTGINSDTLYLDVISQ